METLITLVTAAVEIVSLTGLPTWISWIVVVLAGGLLTLAIIIGLVYGTICMIPMFFRASIGFTAVLIIAAPVLFLAFHDGIEPDVDEPVPYNETVDKVPKFHIYETTK